VRVTLLSLGCKVNQAEISEMESALHMRGHEFVGLEGDPDVCIINTCTVTARSDYQSRQLIRRAARTGARVIVTGCYSELNPEDAASLEGVTGVIKNDNKPHIINMIDGYSRSTTLNYSGSRTRRFLKVQDGCDNSCTYCIVWKARGRSRSLEMGNIISRVDAAINEGVKEVVLTGVHLGNYGQDLMPAASLSDMLENILARTSLVRIRLSSLEINEIDQRLLELIKDSRVCSHLHVPLQSGDDDVLGLMRRNYDASYFRDRVEEIAGVIPGIALGTDVIAGFPSETHKAFNNTLNMIEMLPFTYLHVFPYSFRPGTEASMMTDIVGHKERKKRAYILRTIGKNKKKEYMRSQVGRTLNVLIEEDNSDVQVRGTSDNYLKVSVPDNSCMKGSIVPVRIEGTGSEGLYGNPEISP
jgi:threonylcarbamoyladenosine tRNA methylthiotransferase MtaB